MASVLSYPTYPLLILTKCFVGTKFLFQMCLCRMSLAWVLCLLLLVLPEPGQGNGGGAPSRACDSMVPGHGLAPQSSASPYKLQVPTGLVSIWEPRFADL